MPAAIEAEHEMEKFVAVLEEFLFFSFMSYMCAAS